MGLGFFSGGKVGLNENVRFYLFFNPVCNLNHGIVSLLESKLQFLEGTEDCGVASGKKQFTSSVL